MSKKNQKELISNNSIYKNIYNDVMKGLQYNTLNIGLPDDIIKEIQKPFAKYNYKPMLLNIPNINNRIKNVNIDIPKIHLLTTANIFVNNIKLNDILDGYSEDDIEYINNEVKNNLLDVKESINIINEEKIDISNWQIKLFNKLKKFYKENPIIIGFIINILFPVFIGVMINLLSQNILNIYNKPNNKSTVIYQTNIYQTNIIITNNIPYYYYIETKDKNGNIIKGYVSKRKYNKLKSDINDNSKSDLNK